MYQVLSCFWIILVHIGQYSGEPPIQRCRLRLRRGVRVHQVGDVPVTIDVVGFRPVQPCWSGSRCRPGMKLADMIADLILNDFDAESVCGVYERLKFGNCPEMLLSPIIIDCGVAMVIDILLVIIHTRRICMVCIVVNRCHPEGGDAQRFQIGKPLVNPGEVSAMIRTRFSGII